MAHPQFWRMQLHPSDSAYAMRYAVESTAAGFIGLDFREDRGDMRLIAAADLQLNERDYTQFLKMESGDLVLVMVHHYPFALVAADGEYNYIRNPDPALGVWFRHFRRIDRTRTVYFADFQTNAQEWSRITMTDTISPLHTTDTKSYQLIKVMAARMDTQQPKR